MKRAMIALLTLFLVLGSAPVQAADEKPNGLRISPSRHSITTKAGETKSLEVTVTNRSKSPMDVALNVQQFDVNGNTRAISFTPVKYDWITVKDSRISLQPGTSDRVQFIMNVPKNAAEGEYYFALFAGIQTETKTTRAASLAYVYVDGGNMKRQASIENVSTPLFVFGRTVPFSFDIHNTGNIHLQANAYANLKGLGWESASPTIHQLVVPSQSRSVEGSVGAPLFPGIYTLSYGYTDEVTNRTVTQSSTVLYVPPWAIAAGILLTLVIIWIYQRIRRYVRPTAV